MLVAGGGIRTTSVERSQERLRIIRNRLDFDADSYHMVNQSSIGSLAFSSRPFLDHLNQNGGNSMDDFPTSFSPIKPNLAPSSSKKEDDSKPDRRTLSGTRSPSESSIVSEDTLGSGGAVRVGGGTAVGTPSPGKPTSAISRIKSTESRGKTISESVSFRIPEGENALSRIPPGGGKKGGNELKGITRMFSSLSMDADKLSNGSSSPLFRYGYFRITYWSRKRI